MGAELRRRHAALLRRPRRFRDALADRAALPAGPIEAPPARRFQVTGAAGDRLAQGELQFARKCSVCHTLEKDGRNRAGPSLHGLFGRRAGTLPGYPYSEALRATDIVWTEETVEKLFELGPEIYTPGSKCRCSG